MSNANHMRIVNSTESNVTSLADVREWCGSTLAERPLMAAFNLLMEEAGKLEWKKDLGFSAHKTPDGRRSVGSGYFYLTKEGKDAFNLLWLASCVWEALSEDAIDAAKAWMGRNC